MPNISYFYGIRIQRFLNDHPPPHFYVVYSARKARVGIADGQILNGSLPTHAEGLIEDWWALHREELGENWARIERGESPPAIKPLQ